MSFVTKLASAIFGEDATPDAGWFALSADRLSDYIGLRTYVETLRLYYGRKSKGFVVKCCPLVGADERTGEILSQFFSEGVPKGAVVAIQHWGSPRVGTVINHWFMPRYSQGGVYERIARYRAQLLSDGVWKSLSADAPFHVRNHSIYISVGVPTSSSVSDEDLVAFRESLVGTLASLDVFSHSVEPSALIGHIDDMTSPTTSIEEDKYEYNPYDPIADQCVRRDIELRVHPDRMTLLTERVRSKGVDKDGVPQIADCYPDAFDIRHYAVRNFPNRWAPWECSRLIGDMFTDKLRMPCPTSTVLCLVYPDEEKASAKAGFKFMRTTSLADSKSARFLPHMRDAASEWKHVQDQLAEGRKLVHVFYGVTTYSPEGEGDRHERTVKSIYKAAGWDLNDERFLQIQGLLMGIPLSLADGLADDMMRLRRFRTMLTSTVANIAPMQGEYLGGPVPHMLFVGRRGQPFCWSPFENAAGNHNIAIMGKSGSGKSVALQEMCAALCGAGAKVVVIDDGRSFMNSARLQGGSFVEFTMSSGFCLNPFSMIDADRVARDEDYKLDCMAMLKAIVGQMARYIDRLNDTERGLIDQAVNRVWDAYGASGSVDQVAKALTETGNQDAVNLAIAMGPFVAGGTYASFFSGQATLELDGDFTVFELSDLSSREELRAVVLTAIMFMTTQMMTKSPRSVKKMLLIDEAWQMLRGGSMADFVEAYARTCRKYGGSLATATQSINDYYKSDGATAALENSDWMLVLQQKPETIADFKKSARLEMDERTETLIRSLKRNGVEYSEVFIKGPETQAIGRLVLDPYSATVFSSSPQTFATIERLQVQGLSIEEAIEAVAFPNKDASQGTAYVQAAE